MLYNFKIAVIISFFTFLFAPTIVGQYNYSFVKHLSVNSLKQEHFIYLEQKSSESDSSFYFEAKFHLQYKNDSLFFLNVKKCTGIFLSDSTAVNYACVYFIQQTNENRAFWFDSILKYNKIRYKSKLEKHYEYAVNPKGVLLGEVPVLLRDDFKKFQKAYKKKPLFAASLSSVVPGLGKLYLGNVRSFSATLFSLSLFCIQTIESYNKKGLNYPLTVFNLGFLGGFYAVNIHGSYRETNKKKEEFKNQYLINVSNYFNDFSNHLY